jgi:hypothetical protein
VLRQAVPTTYATELPVKDFRHIVNVMRDTEAQGPDGQLQGSPSVLRSEVPCSIETIGGSEPEAGGQQYGITTYRVEIYGNPDKPLRTGDYLTLGPRRLNIQAIDDRHQNQRELTLICGERHHDS